MGACGRARARLGASLRPAVSSPSDADGPVLARDRLLARLAATPAWDIVIIGGGASGLGCALEAATRGHAVLLVEARDFAAGTSSRSTKLIHGGLRYLAQGKLGLVREALAERAVLLRNAPGLVRPQRFVVPTKGWVEHARLRLGLALYDRFAGAGLIAPSVPLSRSELQAALPTLRRERADRGMAYWDAQFDDAGLAIALARTASREGALVLNHCSVDGLVVEGGRVCGVALRERESGRVCQVAARVVINAAGVWGDAVRRLADPAAPALLRPSQGVHVVVERAFLPGRDALLVPRTADERVLFMIPWQGRVLIGTTDTARDDVPDEPEPLAGEIDFLLDAATNYLSRAPRREEVRSVFGGLRPLLGGGGGGATKGLSREHRVDVSAQGLVSLLGGKWTTYRRMAEDAVDVAEEVAGWPRRPSVTAGLALDEGGLWARNKGAGQAGEGRSEAASEAESDGLPPSAAEVRHAVREAFALGVEDVLARRSRLLFRDAAAARAAAPRVAAVLGAERGWSAGRLAAECAAFDHLATRYMACSRTRASSPP